ncbi:MAG: type II CRISPR-associated endonuclease Cas1 [Pirellulales bacterium]|nr:type II CRISPR-associated endonuclease Cas1 [Pirellulales bacterium]
MIKHTIEISSAPVHLATEHRQLLLKRDGEVVGRVACEDVGVVVVDHPATTYSHGALRALMESDAAVVICGHDHLPAGILLPLADHAEVVWRVDLQVSVSRPLKKRLWQQIVAAKIRAQAENLAGTPIAQRKLLAFADEVRSGDGTLREAQAARVYWQHWLLSEDPQARVTDERFRRLRDGASPNALLNYGYAILRAALARALVAAGLLPALGIQHRHRANAFCLADDLIEPLRPIVDERVRELYWAGQNELDQPTKAALLELLTLPMSSSAGVEGPLMVALHRYVGSLVRSYESKSLQLEIPRACE